MMESIKKKMLSLSQATEEAKARSAIYGEEINRVNEIADKFEEQVGCKVHAIQSLFLSSVISDQNHSEKDASIGGSV